MKIVEIFTMSEKATDRAHLLRMLPNLGTPVLEDDHRGFPATGGCLTVDLGAGYVTFSFNDDGALSGLMCVPRAIRSASRERAR